MWSIVWQAVCQFIPVHFVECVSNVFFKKELAPVCASKDLPFKCHRDGFVHSACRSGHQLRDFEVHGQCRGVAARVALAHQRKFCARILVMNCVTIV